MKRLTVPMALLFLLLMGMPAHAYLDPGSGSMMLQLALGGVAGLLVILKLYWQRLMALFGIGAPKGLETRDGRPVEDGEKPAAAEGEGKFPG